MNRVKDKTFSSAREVFKAYLSTSVQVREIDRDYTQVEERRTNELLEDFKSNLQKQTRRQTS